jgi:hypothetical protein
METPRNFVTAQFRDNTLVAALAEATLKDPMRLFGVCCDLDNEIDDSALDMFLDAAVAALDRRAKWAANRFPRSDLRRPIIFAPLYPDRGGSPLVNGSWPADWLPLNWERSPLGLPDVRPYKYPEYASRAWRFKTDPRTLKGVWSPHSPGDGWLLVRTRNYGECLRHILRATEDPLTCLQSLFDDPPPPEASSPVARPPGNDPSPSGVAAAA